MRTCCVEKNQTSTKVQFPLLVFSIEFRFPQNYTTQSFFIFSYLISIQAQTYRLSAPKLWKLIRHGWHSLSAPVSHVGELEIPDRGLLIQEMTSFRGESVHYLFARSYDDNLFILSAFGKKKKKTPENSPQTGPSVNKCITLPWVNVLKWLKFFIVTHHV